MTEIEPIVIISDTVYTRSGAVHCSISDVLHMRVLILTTGVLGSFVLTHSV